MSRPLVVAALLALACPAGAVAQQDVPFQLRLLVPAYFYPSDSPDDPGAKGWAALIASHAPAKKVEVLPIANVNSGRPGDKVDPNYARVIDAAAKKGMTVLAYVSTDRAKVPQATVKANIDAWLKLYPKVGGFFFDEVSATAKDVGHYSDLCAYARSKRPNAFLVGNPGTYVESAEYLSRKGKRNFDVLVHRENSVTAAPFADFKNPAWAAPFRPERFGAIFHGSPKMQYAGLAREKKVGYLYVTDGALGKEDKRYTQLPTYWADETKAVEKANAR